MKFNHQLACTRVVCSDVVTFKSNIFKTTFLKKKKIGTQIPFTSAHQFTWTVLHDANFTSCTKNTAAFHTNTCIMLTSYNHGCFSHEHLHDANFTSCKHGWFSHEHLPDANLSCKHGWFSHEHLPDANLKSCKHGWFSHEHHTLSSPIQSAIHKHTRNPIPSFLKLSRFIMHRKVNLDYSELQQKTPVSVLSYPMSSWLFKLGQSSKLAGIKVQSSVEVVIS